tara:strand:- start:44 stop:1279 length:1236 start_codon:yes stop_codon:yes gene_type:complete
LPVISNKKDWETTTRKQVRKLGKGWTIRKASKSDKISLVIREPNKPFQEIVLPFKWSEDQIGKGYARVRNIRALMVDGEHTLKQAAKLAESDAPKLVEKLNWEEAKDNFKIYKTKFDNAISPKTWKKDYEPVLTDAVKLLTSNRPPNDPAKLIDKCIIDFEAGSRSRQIKVNSLFAFLEYCFKREDFPASWLPKTDKKEHVGKKPSNWQSQKKHAVSDQEIINLINNFDGGEMLKDALKLISLLGLRPVELLHLDVKKDENGEPYWFCSYQKKSSKGMTKPRVIYELPLIDDDGNVQEWNMISRWQLKDIRLPSLHGTGGAAGVLRDLLRSVVAWVSLENIVKARGENFGLYSLRHSYSVRGTSRNINVGSLAESMGHEQRTHEEAYQKATKKTNKAAFANAMAQLLGGKK